MELKDDTGIPIVLTCVIEQQQIRGVIHHFPSGPVEGYEWRLRVSYPATQSAPARTTWLPWVFGSIQSVQQMLNQWQEYLSGPGSFQQIPPGSSMQ